jgi:CHAD domain-containing protein
VRASTNAGRDAEAALEWLLRQRELAHGEEPPGLAELIAEFAAARDLGYAAAGADLREAYKDMRRRLRKQLRRYRAPVEPEEVSDHPAFGSATAEVARRYAAEIQEDLSGAVADTPEAVLHRARIVGKRLRYLLEPFETEVPACRRVIDRLRELQNVLGDLRDARFLAQRIQESEWAGRRLRRVRGGSGGGDRRRLIFFPTDDPPRMISRVTKRFARVAAGRR